ISADCNTSLNSSEYSRRFLTSVPKGEGRRDLQRHRRLQIMLPNERGPADKRTLIRNIGSYPTRAMIEHQISNDPVPWPARRLSGYSPPGLDLNSSKL